jgi:hypothetical protein
MRIHAARSRESHERRPWPAPSIVLAGAALFIALGGSAVAATGLIHADDLATGAVTSRTIRNGGVEPKDLSSRTLGLLQSAGGAKGEAGSPGAPGANSPSGVNGANGPNGANGANGVDGVDGTDGIDGSKGTDGVDGTNGIDGTIAPLSATKGLTDLPTASPPTTVVELAVPAGNYVVLANTQLFHTGAGDSVECLLKAGAATIDQIAMKTLPALASIPASLQGVAFTPTPTQLSIQCDVLVASGTANFSSLIAIPTA